jgi:hypothetical protein
MCPHRSPEIDGRRVAVEIDPRPGAAFIPIDLTDYGQGKAPLSVVLSGRAGVYAFLRFRYEPIDHQAGRMRIV